MEPFIVCENLVKIYKVAELEVIAIQGLDLTIQQGELIGIVGASGSGKSTFLNVLGGLDRPSAGKIAVNGRNLLKLSDAELDKYRRDEVGFVWQQSARNLIPYLTAKENVELPMTVAGINPRKKRAWSQELLEAVGLWDHRQHKLAQLSGGQQQRVAIAVALANKPSLLLGDEPTGELDSTTSDETLALFQRLNEQYGLTTIIVTHDPQVSKAVDRVVTIRDGRTSSETVRRNNHATAQADQEAVFDEYVMVDGVGRLQIPPDVREKIGLTDRVTITTTEDGAVLVKPVAEDETRRGRDGRSALISDEPPAPKARGLRRLLRKRKRT
ncbi:MAG: ATP-binding cassette domain-containing protein [Chloroflexi bacterium]|nr:ATP-binding cassette domain-containing protein [Chloroflexota bacterium]